MKLSFNNSRTKNFMYLYVLREKKRKIIEPKTILKRLDSEDVMLSTKTSRRSRMRTCHFMNESTFSETIDPNPMFALKSKRVQR